VITASAGISRKVGIKAVENFMEAVYMKMHGTWSGK
jgi:hypothetical protein